MSQSARPQAARPIAVGDISLRQPALHFEVLRVDGDRWSWRLAMRDGTVMGQSPCSYPDRQSCLESLERIRSTIDAPIHGC